MNPLWELWSQWLVRTSWQAGILVLVVLVAQMLFRKTLTAGWRHALWLLVLAKLALPWGPQSPISLFNLTNPSPARSALAEARPVHQTAGTTVERTELLSERSRTVDYLNLGSLSVRWLWLTGTGLLAARLLWQTTNFRRLVRRAPLVRDSRILAAFEGCRKTLDIRRSVRLVRTDLVRSPAIFGYFRPTLLLPEEVADTFSPAELRHVFLHELGHVKRHDTLVLWVVSVLRILHWFNPVLWFGFRRMAADRELACDELVLSHSPAGEQRAYGHTIVRVLQNCARPTVEASVVGILEDRSQVAQRISMIANFKKRSALSRAGLLLLAGLGLFTLTEPKPPAQAEPNTPTPTANAAPSQPAPRAQPTTVPGPELENLRTSYSDLGAKMDDLQNQLRELRLQYTDTHPKVLAVRNELDQLGLQQSIIGQKIRAEENRAAALEAFRKRYGLASSAAQAPSTNQATVEAREAFRRRYGLTPDGGARAPTTPGDRLDVEERDGFLGRYGQSYAFVPRPGTNSPDSRTNSGPPARSAFLRRYGLSEAPSAQPIPATRSSAEREFQTALSNNNLPLRVNVDAHGNFRLDSEGKPVSLEQVRVRLVDEAKKNSNLRLSIRAHKNAPFGQIIKVMDAAKEAKIAGVEASVDQVDN